MISHQVLDQSLSEDINFSQSHLRKQLQQYLKKFRTNSKEIADRDILIKKQKNGNCSGLTALVLYSLDLEYQKSASKKVGKITDNWSTIRASLKAISSWDGERELSASESDQFEAIIAKIEFFQNISEYLRIGQGNLELSLEDTAGKQLYLYYTLAGLFVAEDLVKPIQHPYLKSNNSSLLNTILQPGSFALISSHEHDIGLGNFSGEIYFYDSCDEEGPQLIADLDEAISYIFAAYSYDECEYSPMGFRVFSFDQKESLNLPQKVFLDRTAWVENQQDAKVKLPDLRRAAHTTPLHMAAWIGCTQSLQFYLAYPFDLDAKAGVTKATAKDLAFDNYNFEVLYLLNCAKEKKKADASLALLSKGCNLLFNTRTSSCRGRYIPADGPDFSLSFSKKNIK